MRLSKLEIKGFKSFGEKAIVHFNEGVTAIVGPNGCGKSNVIDAIRWVLGEQSTKALRSEKMENVIFNGTKSKKAAQLAEVSLTFENTKNILPTAYSEICITRKLFRTGDSEYRLNDVQCRLKDITDLFLDTGVGSDSYAIIELKMIDEIISNKEHSRRALFEEAAGIAKFKLRKKQTFAKLNDTEADLSRVEDLLFEIRKNLKVLENQAKKAEKYQVLKDSYRELSLNLAVFKIAHFNEVLSRLNSQNQIINDEILELNIQIDSSEASLQKLKLESLQQEKNLSLQQKTTNDFIIQIRNYENENKLKNQRLHFIDDKIKRLQSDEEKDNHQLNHIKYNQNRLHSEHLLEQEKLKDLEIELQHAKTNIEDKRAEVFALKNTLQSNNESLISINKEIQNAEKEITILNVQLESFTKELERNENESENRHLQLNEFAEKLKHLSVNQENLAAQLINLNNDELHLQSKLHNKRESIASAQQNLMQLLRVKDAKENEFKLTKSLVDNLEGFPQSIKYLRKQSEATKKSPLLSDILLCKEEFRVTIENYLEPVMNFLVVDTALDALEAINQLADVSAGKAGFFVLSSFTNPEDEVYNEISGISALKVLEVEQKFENLCKHLLNNVFIIEDSLIESEILKPKNESIVLLSKSGKFIKTSHTIYGGSVGLFEGKRIGRAKNLELLAHEIKKIEQDSTKIEKNIQEYSNEIISLENESKKGAIEKLQLEIKQVESLYLSLVIKEQEYKTFLESATFQRNAIQEKIEKLKTELKDKEPILIECRNKQSSNAIKVSEDQEAMNMLSEQLNKFSNEFNQQNIAFHQQQNKVNNLLKDIEYRQSQESRLLQQLNALQKELVQANNEKQILLKNPIIQDSQLTEMYAERKEMENGLNVLEQEYYEIKGKINEHEKLQKTLRDNKEQIQHRVNDINDKKVQLKIDLNSLKERLNLEFNVDIEELFDQEVKNDISENELLQKIQKLKIQIDEYGPINSMAVEAYQEIIERYNFIQEQKADLLSAKKSLLDTIAEIDTTAKEKFMNSFLQVRDNFIKVFRSLFNEEDSCDLLLSDEGNPLESEINIIAKPKGKRPLSINQLSGGEKTLTSIALLFSLYLLKPAPFCIFDEVDAPLDDTNIDKFNQIIRKFSKDSQFIIVSHNKKTIANTDIIYGVTMPEQGISKLVAVDLRDFE